jgi:hypothetical protein
MDRGRYELELAKRLDALGADGMAVLSQLSEINDFMVSRMCDAQRAGSLALRDLEAAVLAVRGPQLKRGRGIPPPGQ